MTAYLVYPHQLFEELFQQTPGTVFLVEEPLIFTQLAFHKKKLIFHRASMKAYADKLAHLGWRVHYLDSKYLEHSDDIVPILKKEGISQVQLYDVVDDWLSKLLQQSCAQHSIQIITHPSPGFYLTHEDVVAEFSTKTKLLMANFYIKQRKRFDILLEPDGKPEGGRWSYDTENRKKLPKKIVLPEHPLPNPNPFISEAREYVEKNFGGNYGSSDDFVYPITREESIQWLQQFIQHRFVSFGVYQDAISSNNSFLFHSMLSPMINAGLLTPQEVVASVIKNASKYSIPLESLEGFVRQILGWREFIRGAYVVFGRQERTTNFWNHTRKLPQSFWRGTTGILPIDTVAKRVLKHAYAHHIERLMILANFMQLCEIDPDDVWRYFMELFIDAYDWVMVPNVYGMGEYADGGLISTKPYISGSNYILKMSDFPNGEWAEIWSSLYWNFLDKNRKVFELNPRMQITMQMLAKMPSETLSGHRTRAANYLASF